ncbi:M13-type metalloendopeptidase, partial [Acinetobacter baumannii]
QVLINQYNAYKVLDSIPVNGQLTIGENIADLGGIAIAYDGYQTVCKQKQFNIKCGTKEMFFKSFATIWRSKARDNYAAMLIKMD